MSEFFPVPLPELGIAIEMLPPVLPEQPNGVFVEDVRAHEALLVSLAQTGNLPVLELECGELHRKSMSSVMHGFLTFIPSSPWYLLRSPFSREHSYCFKFSR
jgi:hypothetical protein